MKDHQIQIYSSMLEKSWPLKKWDSKKEDKGNRYCYSAANFCFNKGLCIIWNRGNLSQRNSRLKSCHGLGLLYPNRYKLQGVKKRMDICIFRSSHHIFAPIAPIHQKALIIMNSSLKWGILGLCRSIRTENTRQNVFSVKTQLLCFVTKSMVFRFWKDSDLILTWGVNSKI